MVKSDLLQFAEKYNQDLENGLKNENNCKYLMCFSPIRQNVIAWMDIPNDAKVLEIGGKSTMLTSLLCSKARSVVTVEPDLEYAQANQYVNAKFSNLTIKNALQDVLDDKYDIIVMIGTLDEIDRFDCNGETLNEKICWLLKQVQKAVLSGGELVIAFTNYYGINRIAEGFVDFSTRNSLTRYEMDALLHELGFTSEVYYPVPDYKLAYEVYSDEYSPKHIASASLNLDSDCVTVFDETAAINETCKRGVYDYFANSYLFVCKI